MDSFEKRLKQDAGSIDAQVSLELRERIEKSVRATAQVRPAAAGGRSRDNLWWAASLSGLAAATAVIAFLNWPGGTAPVPAPAAVAETPAAGPDAANLPAPALVIRPAVFTSPLEEELLRLRSDLEKARDEVREDLDFTF